MSDAYLGEIRMFAGNYAPMHWHFCDGALLKINDYQALYTLIGDAWGGDGRVTFAIPDLRGRVPVHQGKAASGTQYNLAGKGGKETVILSDAQLPSHNHRFSASRKPADSQDPSGRLPATVSNTSDVLGLYTSTTATFTEDTMDVRMIEYVGGAPGRVTDPHNNMMPSVPMNYIICLVGIFPTKP